MATAKILSSPTYRATSPAYMSVSKCGCLHADARYWVEESSVQELFSTTCVSLVADSLNEVLGVMVNFNLLSTLRSEVEIPANEERHDYIMAVIALVAARLGVLLGSSVQPDALPMTLIRDRI